MNKFRPRETVNHAPAMTESAHSFITMQDLYAHASNENSVYTRRLRPFGYEHAPAIGNCSRNCYRAELIYFSAQDCTAEPPSAQEEH